MAPIVRNQSSFRLANLIHGPIAWVTLPVASVFGVLGVSTGANALIQEISKPPAHIKSGLDLQGNELKLYAETDSKAAFRHKKDKASWKEFQTWLKDRGIKSFDVLESQEGQEALESASIEEQRQGTESATVAGFLSYPLLIDLRKQENEILAYEAKILKTKKESPELGLLSLREFLNKPKVAIKYPNLAQIQNFSEALYLQQYQANTNLSEHTLADLYTVTKLEINNALEELKQINYHLNQNQEANRARAAELLQAVN